MCLVSIVQSSDYDETSCEDFSSSIDPNEKLLGSRRGSENVKSQKFLSPWGKNDGSRPNFLHSSVLGITNHIILDMIS